MPSLKSLPAPSVGVGRIYASCIDGIGGGYPLVSGMPECVANGVLWQYEKHYFIIHCDSESRRYSIELDLTKNSPTELFLKNLEEALEFIRLTESLRQRTDFPLIVFGRMHSTTFK